MKERFHFSVDARQENRMEQLMEQIKTKAETCTPFQHVSVQFFFPESHPLTMGELGLFNDWLNTLPKGIEISWEAESHDSPELLSIVELQ